MADAHPEVIDVRGHVREEQRLWWRLAFLADEVEYARLHLQAQVVQCRDEGWSWRRLAAATGIPAETLRLQHERLEAQGLLPCGVPTAPPVAPGGAASAPPT